LVLFIPGSVATKDLIETLRFAQGKCNLIY
jgi:hypothetical protein